MNSFLEMLMYTKDIEYSLYALLKHSFLYNSNKIEGSSFTMEELDLLLNKNIIEGRHSVDDVQETINSSKVFDIIMTSIKEVITYEYLKNLHYNLMINTSLNQDYINEDKKHKLENLISWFNKLDKVNIEDVSKFHYELQKIKPFENGNSYIARFIMLKQMLEHNLKLAIILWDNDNSYINSLEKNMKSSKDFEAYINSLSDFKNDYNVFCAYVK